MSIFKAEEGKRWVAGILLGVIIASTGNGFISPVYAEEGAESAPAATESSSTPAPEASPSTESTSEATTESTTPAATEGTPADGSAGGTGGSGETGSTETATAPETPADTSTQTDTGTPGDTGTTGGAGETPTTPPSDGQESTISTGDATSSSTSDTSANTTSVSTPAATSTATTTDTGGTPGGASEVTTFGLDNGLNATTTASSTANTGVNTATDPDGVNIFTGQGISSVFDVLTYNIALVNSSGQVMILQNPLASDLDLRSRIANVFKDLTGDAGTCTLTVCQVTDALFSYIGDNIGDVERNTYAGCNSGKNIGTAEEGAVLIDAGDCTSSNLTVTIGDLTAIHSRYLILLMNKVGNLEGDIVLPDASFFEEMRAGGAIGSNSTLAVDNTADATVHGTSTAATGDNTATGEALAVVDTGNALAHAFTGTFANQINPPSCFIVSVGGTWDGDIYQIPEGFDRETTPYADIICGRGKAAGSVLDAMQISQTNYAKLLVNAIAEATTGGNTGTGQAVAIKSGDAQSFLYVLNILNTTLIGQDWMFGLFTVSGDWDGDLTFGARPNAGPGEQAAGQILSGQSGTSYWRTAKASSKVVLTKTASEPVVSSPSVVEYTLTLKNNGDKLTGAKLRDTLVNPLGATVGVQTWDLGTVKAGEEIVIKYSIEFKGSLVPGRYDNVARFVAKDSSGSLSIEPVVAKASVELLEGEVLGAEDCPAYLSEYIAPGRTNNPDQVTRLETFLRDVRGEKITPDGTYDSASVAAVMRFQDEYADQVLVPWGLKEATGHVFYTTRKTINEINCGGVKEFPLSSIEMQHILAYRNGELSPFLSRVPATSWSATDMPIFARFNDFAPVLPFTSASTASTPSLFSKFSALQSFPLLTLLKDIFAGIAQSMSVEHVQAAVQ